VLEALVLPAALAVAGLRYRLYDLDVLLNRAVVWTGMSAAVLAAYVAGVLGAGSVLAGDDDRVLTLAVTAAVAVGFEPLRRILQRGVDRFLFGRRGEPYAVLRDLSHHLAGAVDPGEAMPRLVTSVADALRVPYVAVEVDGHLVAAAGRPATASETFPLAVHGEPIGRLLVSTRREGEALTRAERRLLRDLAAQSAGAVEAWLLTQDLRRSRERLVLAREEERRRLRSDLHDGFGPALLGAAMQLDAAHRQLAGSKGAALVAQVAADLRGCRGDLRALVDGLRPAALDAGLPAALRQEAARTGGDRVVVDVRCPDDLGPLPAAVEVAALRIAGEAVANVVRHSGASGCRVELSTGADLQIIVADDGYGTPAGTAGGVGLASMRARAEELGGSFTVSSTPAGTTVRARLPLPTEHEPNPNSERTSG
jgi:signal transduction histidine kinase